MRRIKDMTRFELWGYENLVYITVVLPLVTTALDAEVHGPSHDFGSLRLGADPEVTYDEC